MATTTTTTREIHLAARPVGEPRPGDFVLVEREVPAPGPGEILVRNLAMSVDPYMRGRMNDVASYVPPWQLGEAAQGGAVGRVVASEAADVPVDSLVVHNLGWRELALLPARHARRVDEQAGIAPSRYLGVLGMPGLTAYVGLFTMAEFRAGDRVFVSAAAGAVGSLVGQFAHLSGAARVIGSAGSDDKVRHLVDDLGFDAGFNYRDGPSVGAQLRRVAPEGIDVYFDNVGGDHLAAALDSLSDHGRVAMCGSISGYNATEPAPGPSNLRLITGKRLTLRGFIVSDHGDQQAAFAERVSGWLLSGELHAAETVVEGLDHAVDAFLGMLRGENTGKMIVQLAT